MRRALVVLCVLALLAVPADSQVVRLRTGSSTAAAVTPGTTTVTGCQNRVIYGDNSSLLNCEAALGYNESTNVLDVALIDVGPQDTTGGPSITFGDADSGICNAGDVGTNVGICINGAEKFRCEPGAIGCSAYAGIVIGVSGVSLSLESSGVLQFGTDATSSVVGPVLKGGDAQTTADLAGGPMTVATGRSTGAANIDLIFQTGTPIASGSTAQTLVTRQHIEGGFRALTDATATTVFTVTTGNDVACSGTAFVTVEAQDAANVQATRAVISWAAVDATAGAGGEACSAGLIGTNVSAASSGTLTVTTDATTGTDLCNIRVTATGSLTETVGPRARYQVLMDPGSSTCAINPQ